ncbi:hypothetical protein [Aestuariispira ectoiniformans]|uniref:hypothetical protein n=1 Tax=Aestuariispira ectoiniformans TaxID=2775080 RepID=UPI00223C40CC|nr:hypothetical protein [Aestuariispira ectoiniformans]
MIEEQSQITVTYDGNEDRLFLRLQLEGKEVRAWLTRRMTSNLFGIIEKLFAYLAGTKAQPEEQRQAVSQFRQDQALTKANFSLPYKEQGAEPYFQDGPLLVTKVDFRPQKDGRVTIVLSGQQDDKNVAFTMNEEDLRAVMQLLIAAVKKGDWGLTVPASMSANAGTGQKPVVH